MSFKPKATRPTPVAIRVAMWAFAGVALTTVGAFAVNLIQKKTDSSPTRNDAAIVSAPINVSVTPVQIAQNQTIVQSSHENGSQDVVLPTQFFHKPSSTSPQPFVGGSMDVPRSSAEPKISEREMFDAIRDYTQQYGDLDLSTEYRSDPVFMKKYTGAISRLRTIKAMAESLRSKPGLDFVLPQLSQAGTSISFEQPHLP